MPAGPSGRPGSRPKRALTAQLQSGVCACAFRPWNVYEMPPRGGTPYDSSPSPWGGIRGSISYKVGYRVRRNTYCGALYRRIVLTALEMREEAQPGGVTDQDRQRAFAVCAEVRELLRLRVRRRGASAPVVLSRSFLREIAPRRKDRRDGRGAASTW